MNYLLDTNVISEIQKKSRCNPNVAAWLASVTDESLYISVLVVGEIRRGIERLRPRDGDRAALFDRWLTSIVTGYGDRILPIDREIADEWGRISPNRTIPTTDGLMVATARARSLTFVTRNVAAARGLSATTLNPFEAAKP